MKYKKNLSNLKNLEIFFINIKIKKMKIQPIYLNGEKNY